LTITARFLVFGKEMVQALANFNVDKKKIMKKGRLLVSVELVRWFFSFCCYFWITVFV
jgi:hypothetical protein